MSVVASQREVPGITIGTLINEDNMTTTKRDLLEKQPDSQGALKEE